MIKRKLIELLRWLLYILNDRAYSEFGTEIVGIQQFNGELIVATRNSVYSSKDGKPPFKKLLVHSSYTDEVI